VLGFESLQGFIFEQILQRALSEVLLVAHFQEFLERIIWHCVR